MYPVSQETGRVHHEQEAFHRGTGASPQSESVRSAGQQFKHIVYGGIQAEGIRGATVGQASVEDIPRTWHRH